MARRAVSWENKGTSLPAFFAVEYAHIQLNEPVRGIGGVYSLDREEILRIGPREVLAAFGCMSADSACCGGGGARFANVAGYVTALRRRVAADGRPASEVEPVTDAMEQEAIRRLIQEREPFCQVNFL